MAFLVTHLFSSESLFGFQTQNYSVNWIGCSSWIISKEIQKWFRDYLCHDFPFLCRLSTPLYLVSDLEMYFHHSECHWWWMLNWLYSFSLTLIQLLRLLWRKQNKKNVKMQPSKRHISSLVWIYCSITAQNKWKLSMQVTEKCLWRRLAFMNWMPLQRSFEDIALK